MGIFEVGHSGSYKFIEAFFEAMKKEDYIMQALHYYGKLGVAALASATPKDSGLTSSMWGYKVINDGKSHTIMWTNDNTVAGGTPLVVMLQYGHGTGTGGYVQGRDYINPAIQPIFEDIANKVWREVTSA